MWKTPFASWTPFNRTGDQENEEPFFVEWCQRLGPVWVSSLVFTNLAAWSYALFSLRGLEWYFIQHTPITLTDWSCREWRHVQQTQDDSTFGKAAGAGPKEPWKKRSLFWHLCNLFLMYPKWQLNYTHCKFGASIHRWTEFAFIWRTGKQRPRVVHAVTITCLHCMYSFELQRGQAEDPRVVHAITLAPADFSWRTDREGAHGLGPIWQQPSCTASSFSSWRGDNWRRPRGIHAVTSTYIHRWRSLSLKKKQTELTGRTCSATETCGQQPACTASIFFKLQRRHA